MDDHAIWTPASDLSCVPHGPGIYAWYGVPNPGKGDYAQVTGLDGEDRGSRVFVEFLQRHTERLRPPELAVTARGGFWAEWSGVLREEGHPRIAAALQEAGADAEGPARLQKSLQDEKTRQVLAEALQVAAPMAASPLYIGVATSLADRLSTHMRWVGKSLQALDTSGEIPESWANQHFGARAVRAGFRPSTLWVGILAIEGDLPPAILRDCAEALEWLLNRWYRPLLGRK